MKPEWGSQVGKDIVDGSLYCLANTEEEYNVAWDNMKSSLLS